MMIVILHIAGGMAIISAFIVLYCHYKAADQVVDIAYNRADKLISERFEVENQLWDEIYKYTSESAVDLVYEIEEEYSFLPCEYIVIASLVATIECLKHRTGVKK